MAILAATNKQVPDHSIMDYFNKQTYLGNQYSAVRTFTVGTSEIPLLLIRNSQSVNASNAISIFQNLLKVVGNTASNSIILNVYVNPTVTGNGTTLAPVNLRSSYGNNSVALLTYTPTVSANGTFVDSISSSPLSVASSSILKIIDNNQSLLVTGIASASSTSINAIIQWYEL